MPPHLYAMLLDFGVMRLLRQSLEWAGYSLEQALAAAHPHGGATPADWKRSTWERVHARLLADSPNIGAGGVLNDTIERHIRLVCLTPAGYPRYVRLAGPYCLIALHFKAERLRRSPGAHHERCACFWCGHANTECGIHLLVCAAPANCKPRDFDSRVEKCLKRIYLEATKEPTTLEAIGNLIWTHTRRAKALTYLRTLDWPNMSTATVRATLRFIGQSLNLYRSYWRPLESDPPGSKNPIANVELPPT